MRLLVGGLQIRTIGALVALGRMQEAPRMKGESPLIGLTCAPRMGHHHMYRHVAQYQATLRECATAENQCVARAGP
jgi:hypothetical protein